MSSNEKLNAKQFPKVFYARHMMPGLAGYNDETIFVSADAVKKMTKSFVGKPVYIGHRDVNLETIKNDADGYIAESFFNELDGWGWVKFLAIDDKCYEAIANGWAVSNAYVPTEWGSGGTLNNCPYNREIMGAEYTHLAIVPDPRYEQACIFSPDEFNIYQSQKKAQLDELRNSKSKNHSQQKGPFMFKMFKNKKEEVNTIDADTLVEIQNDKGETVEVSVKEMTEAVLNAKAKKNQDEEEKNNDNMEVQVGDEKMPLSELVNRYNAMKKNEAEKEEKENESDDDKEKKNESEDEEKENESDEEKDEKKNSKGDEKDPIAEQAEVNRKHFEELRNAHKTSAATRPIDMSGDKLSRGKSRYGS